MCITIALEIIKRPHLIDVFFFFLGNLDITRGTVVAAGYDITKQPTAARSQIGLCPQHNVLFNELTVHEHLEFFSRLKGFEGKGLRDEIDTLITKLELNEKVCFWFIGIFIVIISAVMMMLDEYY